MPDMFLAVLASGAFRELNGTKIEISGGIEIEPPITMKPPAINYDANYANDQTILCNRLHIEKNTLISFRITDYKIKKHSCY